MNRYSSSNGSGFPNRNNNNNTPPFGSVLDTIFSGKVISKDTQDYMLKVYSFVGFAIFAASISGTLGIIFDFGSPIVGTATVLEFLMIMYLMFSQHTQENLFTRSLVFIGSSFLTGITLSPLLNISYDVDPRLLMTSLLSSSLVFAIFAFASWTTNTASILGLRTLLSTGAIGLFFFSIIRVFIPGLSWMLNISSLLSFALTCGYLLYHNGVLIYNSEEAGRRDHIQGAVMLFSDFVSVFVKILSYFLNSKRNDDSKKKRRDRASYED